VHALLAGLASALAAWGTWRLLAAGRRLLEGRLEEARAQARGAAFGTAAACAVLSLLLVRHGRAGIMAAGAALAAGACALLGGLSGKPVPAAWFSAALLVASFALLAAC
jgi:hypothetical protein